MLEQVTGGTERSPMEADCRSAVQEDFRRVTSVNGLSYFIESIRNGTELDWLYLTEELPSETRY
jgi:hypothetical protein